MPTLHAACACGSRRLHRLRGEDLKIKATELEGADERAEPAAAAASDRAKPHRMSRANSLSYSGFR